MRHLISVLIAGAVFCIATRATAQPDAGRATSLRYGSSVYSEAVVLPSDSAGSARVDVYLRIAYDFMIFEKSTKPEPDSLFGGGVEVSIHARRNGSSVQSRNLFADVYAATYEATSLRDRYLLLRQPFYLPEGRYDILVSITDKGSTRQRMTTHVVDAKRFTPGAFDIGTPVMLGEEERDGAESYYVQGYAASLPFASAAIIGVPVPDGLQAEWRITLTGLDADGDEDELVYDDTVQPVDVLRAPLPAGDAGVTETFDLVRTKGRFGDIVVLQLPFDAFDVGDYRLRVFASNAALRDTVTVDTRIYWRNMPYALRDIEFAIEAMRYILTEEELSDMLRGDERDMLRSFRRYWKERDTTPDTEYNELMTEYFIRVDQAVERFQTLFERNGAATDRGKVYILFGPPEETQRVLNTEEPAEEIWYYPSLNKTFRFIDRNANGDLKLYEE